MKNRLLILAASLISTGCAGLPGMMPDMRAQQSSEQSALAAYLQEQMTQNFGRQNPQQEIQPQADVKFQTESELLANYKALPKAGPLTNFEIQKDGLFYNGKMFADPDGSTRQFSVDAPTATAAYLTRETQQSGSVKVARIGDNSKILKIGTYRRDGSTVTFTSASGEVLRGGSLIPLVDGALVLRDQVGFRYIIGSGVRQVAIPQGWKVTPVQRGNVASTGFFLVEKLPEAETGTSRLLGSLGKEAQDLFKLGKDILGGENNDYALVNGASGEMHLLNFSNSGKETSVGYNCERVNVAVSKCKNFDSYESIWDANGTRNNGHYFWKVDWQMSNGQPVAVVQENGLMSVNALDLKTGKRVNLAERKLGISSMNSFINSKGNLGVKVGLGFDTSTFDDVAGEISSRQAIVAKAK